MMRNRNAILNILLLVSCTFEFSSAALRVGFYSSSCPRAESIVRQVVQRIFHIDRSIPSALLRLHFHDCLVRGCDASILIDSTRSKPSEKSADPNLTVRGYELIDEAKRNLEAACPSTVSCSDVIALATRDAVALAGGPSYSVPTGRRDGLVSDPAEVNLPGPSLSVGEAATFFTDKKLTLNDMVILLGAHTVGIAHCEFFRDRVSDFQGTGRPDPAMDRVLASRLLRTCGTQSRPLNRDPTASLDQNTTFVVDNEFYKELKSRRGILQIDQELAFHRSTAPLVSKLAADNKLFRQSFAAAMIKLGTVEVLLGRQGEVRKNCRVFNKPRGRTL